MIRQLQGEIQKLSFSCDLEKKRLTESINVDLKGQFDMELLKVDAQYRSRILSMEEEIAFLKELNSSQRRMMEDNLEYIRALEEKLRSLPAG